MVPLFKETSLLAAGRGKIKYDAEKNGIRACGLYPKTQLFLHIAQVLNGNIFCPSSIVFPPKITIPAIYSITYGLPQGGMGWFPFVAIHSWSPFNGLSVCGSHSWLPFVVLIYWGSIRGPHSWLPLSGRPLGVFIRGPHSWLSLTSQTFLRKPLWI